VDACFAGIHIFYFSFSNAQFPQLKFRGNIMKRWGIAIAGIVLQIVLGSVYAWSVFRIPLTTKFHWTIPQVTLIFTICIVMLGISSFLGGLWLKKVGPRVVAVTGAFLYGSGTILASASGDRLWWLYLSYGVMGGIGLGFAYIVPITVLVKWFPDRRGLMTGIAVGGFGAGALITAPSATWLIQNVGVLPTFAYLGIVYMVLGVATAWFMQNPLDGWVPAGWAPTARETSERSAKDYTLGDALRTWQWWVLWFILFLNTSAGISVISQESPIFQELAKVTVIVAAGMVGVASIGNAVGRVFWAWISDSITRRYTFIIMFLMQVVLFWLLPATTSAPLLTALAFIILLCYGGGFGTMPAFTADYFGSTNVGPIYGLILTAWGAASAFGPILVGVMRQTTGSYRDGFHILAGVALLSTLLPIMIRPPARRT
jgi:OFA family oxalate/formate antiporter-like MFS transporter